MAMLAMQGIMQRKLVNITLRNTAQKNSTVTKHPVHMSRRNTRSVNQRGMAPGGYFSRF
jgi:hypothetical protein